MIFGFVLAIGITLTVPYLALAAAHGGGSSKRFQAPRIPREHPFSHPFHRLGFLGVGGLDGQQVIIIQQFQSPAAGEPREPIKNGIYVPPRWVDGGHGVQVLRPGYWTDPKQTVEH
jgi:hypothetical protein